MRRAAGLRLLTQSLGTSQAEVPSPEGPLAIWCMAQLARAGWICLFVPVRHSFLKRAVANRMAHKLFSFVRLDIQGGQAISCL